MTAIIMRLYPRRPSGIYYAELSGGERVSLGTRKKALARKLYDRLVRERLEDKITTLTGGPTRKTLQDFADDYLEHSYQTKSRFTLATDSQALRRAVAAWGPETLLTRITPEMVDKWLARTGQQVSRTSANTWFRHLKAAFSRAVVWGFLKENPCKNVKQLAVDEPYPRYLSQDEFARIQAAESDPAFRRLWELYLRTGCRRGEILQLTAEDLDYRHMIFTVRHTKNRRPKQVPMTPEITALFREIPVQVGRLFTWTADHVSHHFIKTAKAAGVKCRLHDLRHTYGSWLIQAGVPFRVVQELMGHRDLKTTERYAFAGEAQKAQAQEMIKIGGE